MSELLTPETKDIIKKMKPETRKLLEDMSEETYKEIASEIISIARPMILAKCSPSKDRPEMSKEEASEIVKGAFGSSPDLPSGKDFVDEVRHGDREKIVDIVTRVFNDGFVLGETGFGNETESVETAEKALCEIRALFPDKEAK